MRMTLSPEMEKLIVDTAAKYHYESVDDFLRAAVDSFEQGEAMVQFGPGELQKLVDEGEQSILEHETVDGREALAARRVAREPVGIGK